MSEKVDFFHLITDRDCAEVRRFLMQHELTGLVSFRNIAYEAHEQALKSLSGSLEVPCIIENGKTIRGKDAVLEYFRKRL